MAEVNAQRVIAAGLEATYTAASNSSQTFRAGDNVFVHIKNASGADCEVTFVTPNEVDGNAIADLVVDVTAGEERFVGPFPAAIYGAGDTEQVAVSWESVTDSSLAVLWF